MGLPLNPSRLDRYVFRQLIIGLTAVTLGLVALVWLTQSLRFIQLIIARGLPTFTFFHLTFLLLPSFFAVILPITGFIVVLFVYSRLASDRELTVMRAVGLSDRAIARPAIALATLVMLACWALNVWMVPASLSAFRKFEFEIRNKVAAFLLEPGVFTPIPGHITVYVRDRSPNGVLHGILIQDDRPKSRPATILARSGRLEIGPNGPEVLLKNGSREEIDPKTGRLNLLSFDSDVIDLAQATEMKLGGPPDVSEASMYQLLHPDQAKIGAAKRSKWRAEVWRRLITPFAALSYTLIALLAVLRADFRRHGVYVAPAVAIGAVVLLVAGGIAAENLAAKNNALIPLIFVVSILPSVIAGIALLGPDRRRRRVARRRMHPA